MLVTCRLYAALTLQVAYSEKGRVDASSFMLMHAAMSNTALAGFAKQTCEMLTTALFEHAWKTRHTLAKAKAN